eukprot:m.200468 g.200468  ORF g.200468 m.200468 type:complete len:69 (+) comp15736_c0_seq4:50-256(+)
MMEGRGPPRKPGDWQCPDETCGNVNFAFRTECHRCGEPKPPGAGGGPDVAETEWICPNVEYVGGYIDN